MSKADRETYARLQTLRIPVGPSPCRKCKGHGLISGENEDGVFFDTCPKCKGTGFSADSSR